MSEVIISTGAALVASGSWFAGKIFGPSVEALGDNLKAHLQTRMPMIFERSEQIAKAEGLEILPLKPGLLTRMIVDASFSEDTPEITEWWSNLFVEASTRQTEANLYAVFSDIMAMIGPEEAGVLNDFIAFYRQQVIHLSTQERVEALLAGSAIQEALLFTVVDKFPLTDTSHVEVVDHFTHPKIPLPVRTSGWKVPLSSGSGLTWHSTSLAWYENNVVSLEILERSRVFKFVRLEIPILADQLAWVDLVCLTSLGREFFEACSRHKIIDDVKIC